MLEEEDRIECKKNTINHLKNLGKKKSSSKRNACDPQEHLRRVEVLNWAKNHKIDKFKSFEKYRPYSTD